MLEASELEEEVIESLILNLRIPLPTSQTNIVRNEILFPAHLIGYLLSQLIRHNLIDRMRELLGRVIKCMISV